MMMSPLADMLWKAFKGVFFTKPAGRTAEEEQRETRGNSDSEALSRMNYLRLGEHDIWRDRRQYSGWLVLPCEVISTRCSSSLAYESTGITEVT
jgi:hypothetical protein